MVAAGVDPHHALGAASGSRGSSSPAYRVWSTARRPTPCYSDYGDPRADLTPFSAPTAVILRGTPVILPAIMNSEVMIAAISCP